MLKKPKLSVFVITFNEEKNIQACLASIRQLADEIVVVDNYSRDKTVDIAKKYSQKVFLHHQNTLGKQRQWALTKTSKDWVLMLDADERISPKLREEINNILHKPQVDAYNIYFQQFFLGKPLPPTLSGGHPRLFKRGKGRITSDQVHERIIIDGNVGQLKNVILHYSFPTISQTLDKFNRYTSLEAREMYNQGVRVKPAQIFSALIYHFWLRQKVNRDYQAGVRGLIMTSLFLIYTFLKWAKIWELQFKKGE